MSEIGFEFNIYGCIVLGIIISIVLPILQKMLPTARNRSLLEQSGGYWKIIKPYVVVGAFSALAAIIIYASLDPKIKWPVALLSGYAWDSTLQKLRGAS